jgi:hypothetical protein
LYPEVDSVVDCMLHLLERLKPLWDFLTAIGTVGLAGLTVWLANRKPKPHLAVSVALDRGDLDIVILTVSDGETAPMLQKYELRSQELKFGRIDIPVGQVVVNSMQIGMGVARLANGDWQQARCAVQDLGAGANATLPSDLTEEQVKTAVRNASIACVTTTGESFRAPLPSPVQQVLLRSINLHRQKI